MGFTSTGQARSGGAWDLWFVSKLRMGDRWAAPRVMPASDAAIYRGTGRGN